jgi:hypothetical protein
MIYTAEEFIAAITQHIPKKSFQMVRYYGWYSNKSRGLRLKNDLITLGIKPEKPNDIEVIDVSKYQPKKVPSLTWRECIKKIWADDPLICPECLSEMRIISFITQVFFINVNKNTSPEVNIIKKILKYLNLWNENSARDPPVTPDFPKNHVFEER